MKLNVMSEAQEKVKSLCTLKDTAEYTELEQLHNSGMVPIKHYEISGSLKGRANVLSRLRELLENSKEEAIIHTTATDFEDKSRVLASTIDKLIKNDVKLKISLSGEAEKVKKINAKYNLKAKHVETDARLFIADKKEALFIITPENAEEEMGIWLNSPYFTDSIASMVEHAFKAALFNNSK
jgi:sugar-specific transcriptional regulator TrmB